MTTTPPPCAVTALSEWIRTQFCRPPLGAGSPAAARMLALWLSNDGVHGRGTGGLRWCRVTRAYTGAPFATAAYLHRVAADVCGLVADRLLEPTKETR